MIIMKASTVVTFQLRDVAPWICGASLPPVISPDLSLLACPIHLPLFCPFRIIAGDAVQQGSSRAVAHDCRGAEEAYACVDGVRRDDWRFFLQRLDGDHWVSSREGERREREGLVL